MIWTLLFLCLGFSSLTAAESTLSLEKYAEMIGNVNPMTRRIRTLNDNGEAMCFTTELTEAFLQYCRDARCTHVLEVGSAYGIKASQIIQTGVFLDANDIDPRHLEIMQKTFAELSKTNPTFNNVRYMSGNIAALEARMGNQKYDAILCESVLHFMHPEEVRKALDFFRASLNPGGRVYITVLSPYTQAFREAFAENKAKGIEWPGFFENPPSISPLLAGVDIPYNVFDKDLLLRELRRAGFRTLKSKYISKQFLEKEYRYDGRDWVIAIAEKEGLSYTQSSYVVD